MIPKILYFNDVNGKMSISQDHATDTVETIWPTRIGPSIWSMERGGGMLMALGPKKRARGGGGNPKASTEWRGYLYLRKQHLLQSGESGPSSNKIYFSSGHQQLRGDEASVYLD